MRQFQKWGYSIGGQGETEDHGSVTSDYFAFTKHDIPGNPSRNPDIDLGFLSQTQNGETLYKLKALFIVTPPRPKDTYLPSAIVRVVLKKGKVTKTITNETWIAQVVGMINTLQVSTPGISSRLSVVDGTPTTIDAVFYERNGATIKVTYLILSATIRVGHSNVALNSGPVPKLSKDLESVFGV